MQRTYDELLQVLGVVLPLTQQRGNNRDMRAAHTATRSFPLPQHQPMTTTSSVETTIRTGRARDAWNSYSSRLEDATSCHVKVTVEDGELCFWVIDPYG